MSAISNKEKHIIEKLQLDEGFVKKITQIGNLIGTNKYDVWIAQEIKKNNNLLNNTKDFQYIIDWVKSEKPNLFDFDFEKAMKKSNEWHSNLKFDENAKNDESADDERIVYRCKDKKHFFIILLSEELEKEGNIMKNCVGGYTNKVSMGKSFIVSLRDEKNESHVTIEIDSNTGVALQIRGKANTEPSLKYQKLITEFAIFASGYDAKLDQELIDLINMQFD